MIRTTEELLGFAAEHGVSQAELAEALGLAQSGITEAKQGKRWKRGIPKRLHERLDAWAERVQEAGLCGCATGDINLNHDDDDDDDVDCADTADPAEKARQMDPSPDTEQPGDTAEPADTEDRQAEQDNGIPEDTFEVLDAAPERISRPLSLVGGKAYAVTWVHTRRTIHRDDAGNRLDPPRQEESKVRVVIDGRGRMYASEPVPGCMGLSKLGLDVTCDDPVPDRSAWSGKGVMRYREGERASPAEVFSALKTVAGHFMSFEYSFAPQEQMEELIACEVIGTYMLPAFNTASYGWSHAEQGAGKTRLLEVIAETAYLGLMCLNSTTLAMMRDIAAYGGTLCFDDVEGLTGKGADPDKQALLLAGNRKGVTVGVKVKDEDGTWRKTFVDVYCSRWFSATTTPIGTLASRTIFFPLVASDDKAKTDREPLETESWPEGIDRRGLVDDLFSLALANLPNLPAYDRKAAGLVSESGRKLQPWRVPLGVALWLQGKGVAGLFDRMVQTMRAYHQDVLTQALSVHQTIIPRALRRLWDARAHPEAESILFSAGDLWTHVNAIADEEELPYDLDEGYISMKSLGHRLRKLRLPHSEQRNSRAKVRVLERTRLERMEAAIAQPEPEHCTEAGTANSPHGANGTNGRHGTNGTDTEPESADSADNADSAVRPVWEKDSTWNGSGILARSWRVDGKVHHFPAPVSAAQIEAKHPGAEVRPA